MDEWIEKSKTKFDSTLSIIERLHKHWDLIDECIKTGKELKDYLLYSNTLDVVYSVIYPVLEKEEKNKILICRAEIEKIKDKWKNVFKRPNEKKELAFINELQPRLFEYNLLTRKLADEHGLYLGRSEDVGSALEA